MYTELYLYIGVTEVCHSEETNVGNAKLHCHEDINDSSKDVMDEMLDCDPPSPQNFNAEEISDSSESETFENCPKELVFDVDSENDNDKEDLDKNNYENESGSDDGSDTDESMDSKKSDDDINSPEEGESYLLGLLRWILIVFFKVQHHFNISIRAGNAILSFISFLLHIIVHPLSKIFPKTVSSAASAMRFNITLPKFTYAVCPRESCNALYLMNDKNRRCINVAYGKLCGAELGFERHLSHDKVRWTPLKKFQFIKPSAWLQHMFQSKEFVNLIDLWKLRSDEKIFMDVYDGRIWKDLAGQGFFTDSKNLGLMLNIDWFKPMKRSEYKVAAIMLTVLNLPREERFKKKWTIISGI